MPTRSPTGSKIRDLFDASQFFEYILSGISDHERLVHEMQTVGTKLVAAQDHTFDAAKNYQSVLGGRCLWDAITETGEVDSCALVTTTKAKDITHAAEGLACHHNFNPKVLFCDTWPHNKQFWELCISHSGKIGQ